MENQENQSIHLYSEGKSYKLYQGSMLDMLEVIESNSIDAIVTDPPYELNFMNKGWDNSGIAFQKETWEKCLKVLKPGGYLLAFGGSRTFHRIACAIEDAGFEIRDTILWLYGSGFPKSMNIGLAIDKKNGVESEVVGSGKSGKPESHTRSLELKDRPIGGEYEIKKAQNEWDGWGTALKPAYEPVIVSRKPCEDTCVDNVMKYGVGGINIDECRVPANPGEYDIRHYTNEDCFQNLKPKQSHYQVKPQPEGRFPANVILTYDDTDKEEVCGSMPDSGSGNNGTPYNYAGREYDNKDSSMFNGDKPQSPSNYNDNGSAARYFYCAKASKRDRDEGLDNFAVKSTGELQGRKEGSAGSVMNPMRPDGHIRNNPLNPYAGAGGIKCNSHPTVKPTALMQYLVRLVTPKGGTVLDPFNGSGSTGKACMYENVDRNAGYTYIGIELTPEYLPISKARIEYAATGVVSAYVPSKFTTTIKKANSQINLFEL